MGLNCKLLGHKWDGCKCVRCSAVRDEQHKWNGCKCTRCGQIRDEGHRYTALRNQGGCASRCEVCGKTPPIVPHKWKGLLCTVCGEERRVSDITDQIVIEHIARDNNEKFFVRDLAIDRLINGATIADLAKNDKNELVRQHAIGKLTDYEHLADIAQNDDSKSLRELAAKLAAIYKDPAANEENCKQGVHVWEYISYNNTGDSSTSSAVYKCRICGKRETRHNAPSF